jgi:hypothetical protein
MPPKRHPVATNIAQIKAAKPAEKPVRLFDEKGLYLEISPTGSKLWRWKYRFNGKEKRLSFGACPEVSLADARSKTLEKRTILAEGFDPAAVSKALEVEQSLNSKTFEEIVREWHSSRVSPEGLFLLNLLRYFLNNGRGFLHRNPHFLFKIPGKIPWRISRNSSPVGAIPTARNVEIASGF